MAESRKIKVSLKCPYYTINTLFLIASIITFVMSLALKYEFGVVGDYLDCYSGKPILFLLAGSSVLIADACLGLIALSRRSYCGIMTFLFCTVCLFIAMLILVTLTYTFSSTIEDIMYKQFKEDMNNPNVNNDVINTIQIHLNCCGYDNFSDWKNNINGIPQSCCSNESICDTGNSSQLYSIGCRYALECALNSRKWIITAVLGVIGFIELVSIILSMEVCRNLKTLMAVATLTTTGNNVSSVANVTNNKIPRIHNPLGLYSLSSVDNVRPYIRRPNQLLVVLNYRSPHESFLRQPPQIRFDRRVAFSNANHLNPYAANPR